MPSRLPTTADFSPHIAAITSSPNPQRTPTNVVLFLHGLGDTAASFSAFPRALNLPETLCVSLQAPTPLPFDLGGFHWGDDILFDQSSGAMDFDAGFGRASKMIAEVVKDILAQKCGYNAKEIMLFGFGQGGMAALAAATTIETELAGIMSIGGPVPASINLPKDKDSRSRSPVLVLGGSSQSLVGRPAIMEKFKETFENVQYHKWNRVGDSMPRNRDEMLPIMQFFARRLRSRQGVPEGSIEIG
jgi:predicted esterase